MVGLSTLLAQPYIPLKTSKIKFMVSYKKKNKKKTRSVPEEIQLLILGDINARNVVHTTNRLVVLDGRETIN